MEGICLTLVHLWPSAPENFSARLPASLPARERERPRRCGDRDHGVSTSVRAHVRRQEADPPMPPYYLRTPTPWTPGLSEARPETPRYNLRAFFLARASSSSPERRRTRRRGAPRNKDHREARWRFGDTPRRARSPVRLACHCRSHGHVSRSNGHGSCSIWPLGPPLGCARLHDG